MEDVLPALEAERLQKWGDHCNEVAGLTLEEINIVNELLVEDDAKLNLKAQGELIDEGVLVSEILGVVEVDGSLHLSIEQEV